MSIFKKKKKRMSENGTIHITMVKNWVGHILFLRHVDPDLGPNCLQKDISRRRR